MTDHQQDAGPVDAPAAPVSTQQAIKAMFAEQTAPEAAEPEAIEQEQEFHEELVEGESEGELDAGDFENEGEPEGEQETAIAAPISLNAEEKEAFGQLSPEAQAFVTSLETRRNADVTKVTTKAADAQRAAEAQAAQQAIQAKQEYARQLEGFMANFAPQMPDPSLAQSNPAAYVAAKAQYDAESGQFEQIKHQIAAIGQEAEQEAQATFIQERDKALMQIPQIANEDTRQEYLDRVFDPSMVEALGYDRAELAQIADAEDVKRLNTIADWREKAAKYDAAMSKKMKRVRQGKARATRPAAAQEQSSNQRAIQEGINRQRQSGGRDGTREALKALLS